MSEYADSTVAMSAYNLIAVNNGAKSVEALAESLVLIQHPELEAEQVERAVKKLEEMGYITQADDGSMAVKDPARRVVVDRDRTDAAYDEDTGDPIGGWNGWRVRDPRGGMIAIEDVIHG